MNAKLIAVVLAALPAAAMADVTLYGSMKGDLEHNSQTQMPSQNDVQDDTSLIGFKGTEDLGNGLKTVWQIESRVHLDGTGTDTFATRQTFVGLDGGSLGQIRLGYLNNSLNDNYATDQWQYDSIYRTAGAQSMGANGLGVFTNSGDRLKNAIRYDSASFSGFSGNIAYGFGENSTNTPAAGQSGSPSSIASAGLNYSYDDAFSAHYAYVHEANPMGTGAGFSANSHSAAKQLFELDYSANNLFVSGAYQWSYGYDWVDDFAGDGGSTYMGSNPVQLQLKAQQAALSVAYTIGAFTPKATYAKGWDMKSGGMTLNDSGYRQYILGIDYALSKRTTAGIAYGNTNFGTNTSVAAGTGSDSTVRTIAFTMAHNF